MSAHGKKIMLVAGEASGDHRGGEVASALLTRNPNLTLYGVGGEHMRAAGVQTLFDVSDLAVMGFVEPLVHLPTLLKIFARLKKELRENRPDLLILIDYPGFNLRLAKVAKKLGIKVLFYISPQVWAWRQGRVKKIAQVIDHMAVIFPFEEKFYREHDVAVTYVGHPLGETIPHEISKQKACEVLARLNANTTYITLLPGSRNSEVERLLQQMTQAAVLIREVLPEVEFLLSVASTVDINHINELLKPYQGFIHPIQSQGHYTIAAADLVITASGTATLETALLNRPMIVVYKVNRFTAWLAKRLIKIPYVSLCNIVAGKQIVPELLQEDAEARNIADEALNILRDEARYQGIQAELVKVRENLGASDAAGNVAKVALEMMTG